MIFSISQIFGELQPDQLSSLFDQLILHRFRSEELLFNGQAKNNRPLILILKRGAVAIRSSKPNGQATDLHQLGPGAIICYLPSVQFTWLVDEELTIIGVGPGEAFLLSAADFHALKQQGVWRTPLK